MLNREYKSKGNKNTCTQLFTIHSNKKGVDDPDTNHLMKG